MIFENESLIDDNLLELVKKIKYHAKENPTIKFLREQHSWIVTIPEKWISSGINVTWNHINKRPFRVWWEVWSVDPAEDSGKIERNVLMDVEVSTVKDVIDALLILRYSHLGIPKEILDYLANKMKVTTLESALKLIGKETDTFLTIEQMKTLGITEQRGTISGKKFGL